MPTRRVQVRHSLETHILKQNAVCPLGAECSVAMWPMGPVSTPVCKLATTSHRCDIQQCGSVPVFLFVITTTIIATINCTGAAPYMTTYISDHVVTVHCAPRLEISTAVLENSTMTSSQRKHKKSSDTCRPDISQFTRHARRRVSGGRSDRTVRASTVYKPFSSLKFYALPLRSANCTYSC